MKSCLNCFYSNTGSGRYVLSDVIDMAVIVVNFELTNNNEPDLLFLPNQFYAIDDICILETFFLILVVFLL